MKLLFTSSDPGSAQQNNVIATFFKKRNNAIIGYISSQVASEIPGIKTNMINLCKALNEVKPGYKLNVKPHTLDKNSSTLKYLSNKYFLKIINPKNTPVELLLMYNNNFAAEKIMNIIQGV